MMLLMGMNNSLMKYPTAPITAKPIAHEPAIFKNSKEISLKGLFFFTFFIGLGASVKEESGVLDESLGFIDDIVDLVHFLDIFAFYSKIIKSYALNIFTCVYL
jgi:hypothetical protein